MIRTLALLVVSLLGSVSCISGGRLEDPQRFDEGPWCTLDLDVPNDVLGARCGGECHSGERPAGELDLVSEGVLERLVGAPSHTCPGRVRIVPGDPDASFLVEKLEDRPECGLPMPFSDVPLTRREIECVRAWVREASLAYAPEVEQ